MVLKGLAWVKVVDDGLSGPIARFFEDSNVATLKDLTQAESGDLVMFVADKTKCSSSKFRCFTY